MRLISLAIVFFVATPLVFAAEVLDLAAESTVEFSVRNFLVTTVHGSFKLLNGSLTLEPKFIDSRVEATLDIASVNTGNEKRDAHLCTVDFFDCKQFPTMKFVSHRITGDEKNFAIDGTLNLHGVSQTVRLIGQALPSTWPKRNYAASGELDRNKFNIKSGASIGDTVKFSLNMVATPR